MFAGSRLLLPVLRTLLHWCRNPGKKEAGTGEHSKDFNKNKQTHNKAAAPHGRLPHTKHKLKSRPGPLSSSTVIALLLSFRSSSVGLETGEWRRCPLIIINSTGLAPFPRLSAPPHSSQYCIVLLITIEYCFRLLRLQENRKLLFSIS